MAEGFFDSDGLTEQIFSSMFASSQNVVKGLKTLESAMENNNALKNKILSRPDLFPTLDRVSAYNNRQEIISFLYSLIKENPSADIDILHNFIPMIYNQMTHSGRYEKLAFHGCAIFARVSTKTEFIDTFTNLQIVPILLELIAIYSEPGKQGKITSLEIIFRAVTTICNLLAVDTQHCKTILEYGAVRVLLQLLRPFPEPEAGFNDQEKGLIEKIQVFTCSCFVNILMWWESAPMLLSQPILHHLIKLLPAPGSTTFASEVQKEAIVALMNISTNGCCNYQRDIIDDLIDRLLPFLTPPESVNSEFIAHIMSSLLSFAVTFEGDDYARFHHLCVITQRTGVLEAIGAFKSHPDEVIAYSAATLYKIFDEDDRDLLYYRDDDHEFVDANRIRSYFLND